MKNEDNQNVGNSIPTDNLNTGGENTLNNNNNGNALAVENAKVESVINSEVIGVTNNENLNNLSGEETLPPKNNLNNTKNHKKLFIIIGIVLGVVILAIIVFFAYIKTYFTAEKYIDDKVNEITSFVDEIFMTSNYNTNNDTLMNGELSINSSAEDLAMLNNLNVNLEVGTSLTKEIIDINLGLANNESNYNANLYINNNRMYLDSKDLYSTPLYMDLEESPFANINIEEMNLENYKNSIVNFVKYLSLALKESEMSSSINGFNANYRYEINDNNKEAFANKINELIEQDKNMKDFLEVFGVTNTTVSADSLSNMEFVISVSIFSDDIKSFTFTIDNLVISLVETAKDKYDLKINDEVVLKVTVDGDNINLISNQVTSGFFDITFNTKDYTMEANFTFDSNVFSLKITNESNNVKKLVMKITSNGASVDMKIDMMVEKIDDNASKTSGSFVLSSNGEDISIDFTLNSQNGSNLVEEKDFLNAKDMNTLTATEESEISNNLMNIFEGIFPNTASDTQLQQFYLNAQIYVSTAGYTITPNKCITIDELDNESEFLGKFEGVDQGFRVSITNGRYMILNKFVSFGENIEETDIEVYDSSRFTEEYYTCGVS